MPSDTPPPSAPPVQETHASISVKLLLEASEFFENLGKQDKQLEAQMNENARVFKQMGVLLEQNPLGMAGDRSHAELTAALLNDSADFFRKLGARNEPIKDKMNQNADIYEQISILLAQNPTGIFNPESPE